MIKSDELRLWNFVFDKEQNKIDIIDVIEENRVSLLYSKFPYTPINLIQPVELTPDILEAAGFDSENYMFIKDVFDSRIAICYDYGDRQCGVGFSQRHMFWTNCKYLHQLQNLLYCLTGDELQIDITKLNK